MAFTTKLDTGKIDVIVLGDSAVRCSKEDYDSYLESFISGEGNEDFLNLDPESKPTRYVMRKILPFNAKQALRTKNIKMNQGGDDAQRVQIDINYPMDIVRMALVDIKDDKETPKTLANTFKRDNDGFASKDLVSHLDDHGQMMYLFAAHNKATSPKKDDELDDENKKK